MSKNEKDSNKKEKDSNKKELSVIESRLTKDIKWVIRTKR